MKVAVKRAIGLAAAAVVVLVGLRIWAVQAEAAWPPITTERYGEGDMVALEGCFITNKRMENTNDYSVRLVDASVMSYNEFVNVYAKDRENTPYVAGLDSPSVIDLELEVFNDGDSADEGGIYLLGLKLFPERRNTYFLWDTDLLQVEYDNFEDEGLGFAVEPHSTQTVHIPFTINGNYEDKTEYKQNITDTNFELVMTNSPVRKVINFSL
ncbi:hypothetical protein [Gordonibacter urolithinfaciens]|uniref:DUF5028 domain-containing protein n=2 Tax=Gordonibacter urolithinfaciens TaxID=1335613 RepID=A0A6N8ILJ3_9ACTN|nr:hypothetical protein [Gordonibacter urolithinfaciens]MVM55502.1 hypothetical protein [Gordonibacter urolithinfaciens]MVN16166.1 hypothetical protein [Gordonibacter urolithinfaciens]MVN39461.1 hypothetical protein [Gordonibacter urolithinfaciens]MVN57160.1 hypothetical protein [Gordonibacter urolithinfaciens]MVN62322.1 hypothetical protein [Gordonibacter urolithinfaciens]